MVDFQAELKSFNQRLEKLNQGMQLMKTYGLDESLLVSHLCHNLKISEKKAKYIMSSYEDFYNLLLKERIVKDLNKKDKQITK